MLRSLPRWGLAVCVCLAACASGALADALDPPSLSYVNSGRGTIRLLVSAGPSGAPGGFTLEWIPAATYDALGGWPDETDARIMRGTFYGSPTLNTTDGTTQYRLTSIEDAGVQLGDFFDETGVATAEAGELDQGTEYVVRGWANTFGSMSASIPCDNMRTQTTSNVGHDCTYTLGYWKTHPLVWPVNSLKLGTVTYTQAELLEIYDHAAKGNGLVSLAHQLIAAKLNIANGASAPPAVTAAIASADALIGSLVVPPVGSGFLAPSSTSGLTETLDEYNNGELGPDHCDTNTTAGTRSSWGRVKSLYR